MTNAEARFNKSLRPRKPEGSLGRTAQDVHLDSRTAPELCEGLDQVTSFYGNNSTVIKPRKTHSMTIATRQKHLMLPFSLELLLTWKVEQMAQHLPLGITDFRWTRILTQCAKHFPSVSFFY